MRTNVSRCLIAVFAATLLSGCSSSQLGMPNLAFWKRSPFQSTPLATPGQVGSPVRPSAVAANSGAKAPVGSYAANTASTSAPAWTPPNTPTVNVTPGTPYPSPQNPYQTTTPPAYTASTAGVPGAGAYGTPRPNSYGSGGSYGVPTMPPVSPYGGTSTSPNSAAPAYSPPAESSYNAAGNSPGSYVPTNTPPKSYNPVRPASSYQNTQPSPYGGASGYNSNIPDINRYSAPKAKAASPSPYGAGRGTESYAPKTGSRYGDGAYSPPASNPSGYDNPAATPSYDGGSRYKNTTPNYSGPSGTDSAPSADNRYPTPSDRYSSSGGNAPLMGSRYSSPSAAPPTTGSGGYTPPASSYAPPSSGSAGYTVPSVTTPDASRYSSPSSGGTTPAYRPGSTGDYVPPQRN